MGEQLSILKRLDKSLFLRLFQSGLPVPVWVGHVLAAYANG